MARAQFTEKPPIDKMRKAALQAAHAAGEILRANFGKKLKIREKSGAGLVTDVDVQCEKAALKILRRTLPDFGVLAEESAAFLSSSLGRWIIDPLDGTTNFIHGFPMFCCSIAAEWDGKVQVGVIYHPILDETYLAVRGQGATVNGEKLRVSKTAQLEKALLTTGFAYTRGSELRKDVARFERLSQTTRAIRRPGSAALDLAYTARGVFDGFWERNLAPWDVAAGTLLVEEAGGLATDFIGRQFAVGCNEVLVANPKLHREILTELAI
jgi:myo-inositol-1(or 4)-monophosphatase